MRGLDADQVYEYLDLLADQVQAADDERRVMREENERLQAELQRVRSEMAELEGAGDRVNGQVVELLSQAQLVAEEMVEDVSRDARDRLGQAREQERKILEEAMETADRTRRDAEALIRWTAPGVFNGSGEGTRVNEAGRHSAPDVAAAAAELEQVRSFARAAQAQMQSIMESFSSEVGRLGTPPQMSEAGLPVAHQNGSGAYDVKGHEQPRRSARDPWA
jgi:cell division septum initiation protein DivIVA